ncbi:MAG TPA: 12-oxophytodienoate reductase [Microbacteriaceae bacterium]|nr:12-oxophytodienoate reductase [Microbacteriaceae bacterium]
MDLAPMFEPIAVGPLTLRNRFVMPGMQREWCVDGAPTPRLAEYYRRRAAGGTALVNSEACAVDHPTSTQSTRFAWLTPRTADAWARCAAAVRGEGAEFFIQLWHEGAVRDEGGDGPYAEHPTLSPSGLLSGGTSRGRAMTTVELDEIEASFVRSAILAKSIGASGVEVHACHGYLLDQFLWAATNRRDDGYGGDDLRDRVRFPARIVASIRQAVGPDFAVSLRFSQWKEVDYDARIAETPEELRFFVETFQAAGVDMFHASTRRFWTPEWPELDPDLGLAGWVKRFTDLPVAAVGSLGLATDVMTSLEGGPARQTGRPAFHELIRRFERGDFDLMTVGRAQIADPDWVAKVRRDAIEELLPFDERIASRELEDFVA